MPMNRSQPFILRIPEYVYVVILSFVYYSFFAFDSDFSGDRDLFFHAGIVRKILEEGYIYSLPEMFFSFHAERYVDYHFLFHYLSVPFVLLSNEPLTGMKFAFVTFLSVSAGTLHYFFMARGINYRVFFTLIYIAASPIFTGRLLFGRGVTIFLSFIFALLSAYEARKKLPIFVISFVSVWTYTGFPIIVIFAFIYLIVNFFREGKVDDYELAGYSLVGVISGIILHHAFPHQFMGFYYEYVVHFLGAQGLETIAEWGPPRMGLFFMAFAIPGSVFMFVYFLQNRASRDLLTESLFVLTSVFVLLSALSTKFIEYGVPLIAIAGAMMFPNLGQFRKKVKLTVQAGGVLFLILIVFFSIPQTYVRNKIYGRINDPSDAKEAAFWLEAKVDPGERIVLHWPDFPYFFYYAPSLRYPFGLNPVYSFGYDIGKYINIRAIYDGVNKNPAEIMKHMNSKYIVVNRKLTVVANHNMSKLVKTRKASIVYYNTTYVVYKIHDSGDIK